MKHRKQNCKTGMVATDHLVHWLSDFSENRFVFPQEIAYTAQIEKAIKGRAVVVKIEEEVQGFLHHSLKNT